MKMERKYKKRNFAKFDIIFTENDKYTYNFRWIARDIHVYKYLTNKERLIKMITGY